MKENSFLGSILFAFTILAAIIGFTALASEHAGQPAPIFVQEIPPGYRDWKVVTVSHEADDLNDIRAVLGNDIAIKAYRENKLPFPEGAIIGRIAWSYAPSEEFNKTFGKEQSFVAGPPTEAYLQFMPRTQRGMPRPAVGDTRLSIRTSNLPT